MHKGEVHQRGWTLHVYYALDLATLPIVSLLRLQLANFVCTQLNASGGEQFRHTAMTAAGSTHVRPPSVQ